MRTAQIVLLLMMKADIEEAQKPTSRFSGPDNRTAKEVTWQTEDRLLKLLDILLMERDA